MNSTNIGDQRAYGRVVLIRFSEITVPPELKPLLATYKKSYEAYDGRAEKAEEARAKRDDALELVGAADDVFDPSVDALADKIVGAGLGTRQKPFEKFSNLAPSQLKALPYAQEPKAIRALGDKLLKAKPPAEVAKAYSTCLKNATAIESALDKLAKPQAAYDKALRDRDALLPDLTKALRKLKKQASVTWDDDPATYASLFAPPDAVQAPKKKRAKKTAKSAKKAAPATPPAPAPATKPS